MILTFPVGGPGSAAAPLANESTLVRRARKPRRTFGADDRAAPLQVGAPPLFHASAQRWPAGTLKWIVAALSMSPKGLAAPRAHSVKEPRIGVPTAAQPAAAATVAIEGLHEHRLGHAVRTRRQGGGRRGHP